MKYDVIIIGSGLGGLSAGAILAKNGKKVLILESHNIVGGCATTYKRKGVTFEVGLHEMDWGGEGFDIKYELFKKLGLFDKIELIDIPNAWDIKTQTSHFKVPHVNSLEYFKEKFPHEKEGLEKYFKELENILYTFNKLPYDMGFFEFFFYPILKLPQVIRYKMAQKSIGQMLDELIDDDKLKRLLNANIAYYADDPYKLCWQYHALAQGGYYKGAKYIKGGSGELSNALASIITENGGEVKTSCLVTKVGVANGCADEVFWTHKKEEFSAKCDKIIANCSPELLYQELLEPQYQDETLKDLPLASSLYTIYFIFKKPLKELYADNAYSTFITTDEILNAPFNTMCEKEKNVKDRGFAFVDYSVIDSGLCSDDRSFGVVAGVSYLEEWSDEYKVQKEELAQTIIAKLEAHYPNISEYIEYYEVSTPKSIQRYIHTPTAYGYAQEKFFDGRVGFSAKKVKNLHFASAWTFPGGGFTGALISGYMCANILLKGGASYIAKRTAICVVVGTLVGSLIGALL